MLSTKAAASVDDEGMRLLAIWARPKEEVEAEYERHQAAAKSLTPPAPVEISRFEVES